MKSWRSRGRYKRYFAIFMASGKFLRCLSINYLKLPTLKRIKMIKVMSLVKVLDDSVDQ